MNTPHFPVVVAGAGPVGSAVATLLSDYGIECLVLDRWESVYPQPRAVHLDDEVHRIVSRLGLADEFARISRPGQGLRLVDRDMRVLAEFRRSTATGVHGFPQANMFDQPEFEQLLRSGLARRDTVTFRGNVEITDVANTREGSRVTFVDRATGLREFVNADYVLGCDGANSIVRSSIGSRMDDMGFEQRWLVVDLATGRDLEHWEGVHQVCDPIRAATYMRIGETRYRWEFRLLPGESAERYSTLNRLQPLLAPWIRDVDDSDFELVRVADYTFRAQVADRWRDRRVFLLGDAAHLTPPFIGQGMGAGLRDSANLAWKLAGVIGGTLPRTCLDSYETERKPHAASMIRLAVAVGWAMTEGGTFGNAVRRTLAPLAVRVPALGSKIIEGVTPSLRASEFVHRDPVHVGLSGSLCPNAILDADGRRLDDVAHDAFVVVTTIDPTEEQRYEIERRGAQVIRPAAESNLGRWLAGGRITAAIVRPDRTVLRAGRSLSRLYTHLPTFTPETDGGCRRPVTGERHRGPGSRAPRFGSGVQL
ncbi:MAG: bifunctional 3-(3-hydroxy-phenyl)propionate/3-hydroxycinnamic acid hydroxylase [Rhodococcus sp. (in: high G+C Gram-positive bacteria)]|uniref:bifunctional 3-(3-hydroxy-phenyl)propionate/3-hydroxycinnamic acid hydroxylase MhpA n=1 Tax=Rhodococcus sp. TaxID=1831 RepID=UPI003BAF3716